MPRAEQQDDIGRQLLIRELVAVFLRLNEMRGEIVARLAPAELKQPPEILGHGQIVGILLFDFGFAERSRRPSYWCENLAGPQPTFSRKARPNKDDRRLP